jgi:5-methylcytosine-specific restriction endonuclease McrA
MKHAHYLCENCLRKGIYRPADVVHHIIELDPINIENPEITMGFDNLEAVCNDCHNEYHDNHGRWVKINEAKREARASKQRYSVDKFGKVSAR